eukprot:TRINITY_DN15699_c0_g1_i2.p2 TRINITY_DN15699_c0_g1~~TRINITY_DN15699_c0_g1_i2.p2  ORF type:complete len:313 (+),score=11.99 TRINITY_DN15699_c0_g1_i2:1038-1976(+)
MCVSAKIRPPSPRISVHVSEIEKLAMRSGSIDYFAPERMLATSEYGAKVDVYSCGLVLFFCLVGISVFGAVVSDACPDKGTLAIQRLWSQSCEQHVCSIVRRLSRTNPEKRPTSCEARALLTDARKQCRAHLTSALHRTRNLAKVLMRTHSSLSSSDIATGFKIDGGEEDVSLPGAMSMEEPQPSTGSFSVVVHTCSPRNSSKSVSEGRSCASFGIDCASMRPTEGRSSSLSARSDLSSEVVSDCMDGACAAPSSACEVNSSRHEVGSHDSASGSMRKGWGPPAFKSLRKPIQVVRQILRMNHRASAATNLH